MLSFLILSALLSGCSGETMECPENELVTVYRDEDRDGFGDEAESQQFCVARLPMEKWATVPGDCDDTRSDVYPGAPELCDGVDNSCNGLVDDGLRNVTFWQDYDEDGFGNREKPTEACTRPEGYVQNDLDCDDYDPLTYPGAPEVCDGKDNSCNGLIDDADPQLDTDTQLTWYFDNDGDGYGNPELSVQRCDQPPGTVANNLDCDDNNPEVNPDAIEVCDGIDNNCNGHIDDSDASLDPSELLPWCRDADGDGYGDPDQVVYACDPPWYYVGDCTDCDDTDPLVFSEDDTWWVHDADGDGYGAVDGDRVGPSCTPPGDDYVLEGLALDCDDTDPAINPSAPEVCDGIDNNCSGFIDDEDPALDPSLAPIWFADTDEDGFGDPDSWVAMCIPPENYVDNDDDCDDTRADVNPDAVEVCDGVDNTCNGLVDDDDPDLDPDSLLTWYLDFDGDGWGDPAVSVQSCAQPPGYVDNDIDCDDNDPDSGAWRMWLEDQDGDGFGAGDPVGPYCHPPEPTGWVPEGGPIDCDDTDPTIYPGAPEICDDGIDQSCDGMDEECLPAMADTCAEALTEEVLTSGVHSFEGDFGIHTNAISFSTGNTCTGRATEGADGIIPVRLEPGEAIWALYTNANDASLYLLDSCSSPTASSCVLGADLLGAGQPERLWAHNTSASAQDLFLVADCVGPACGEYTLEFEIGEPDPFFLPDTCSEAQTTPPLQTGGYAIRGNNGSQTNSIANPNNCTGWAANGTDSMIPILLKPGEALHSSYLAITNDASYYLVTDCDSGPSCVAGADNTYTASWETFSYTHTGASDGLYYLVLDCWSAACNEFELQMVIEPFAP